MSRIAIALLTSLLCTAAAADEPAPATAAPAEKPKAEAAPKPAPAPGTDEHAVLETAVGKIVIDLFEDKTPGHAENFKKLVRQGYYDGSPFHRVIEGFMAQGGGKWGEGPGGITDVGYRIPAEIRDDLKHERASVAAARMSDIVNPQRESSGSQFYICFEPTPFLDGGYTVFGKVVSGMENVDKITRGAPGSGAVPMEQATVILKASLVPAGTAAK